MFDKIGTVTGEHVDDRNLDHRVTAGLQTHGSTGNVDKYLTCEGGIVDAHIELQTLVLGLTTDPLTHEVHTVTHIAHIVDALHLEHMRLIAGEVRIGLDVLRHILELGTIFKFHIHHTAVDTLTEGDGHREGVLDTFLTTHAHAMTHRHTGTEVGLAKSLRSKALHEGTDDGVGTRIPTGGNHTDGVGLLVELHQTLTVAADIGVDVERVDGIDA